MAAEEGRQRHTVGVNEQEQRSRRPAGPARADAPEAFSKLTVHLGLGAPDEVGPGHHDEVDAGPAAGASRRKLSRSSRRARLRVTAPPTRRLTARPIRSNPSPLGAATRRNRRTVEAGASLEDGVELGPGSQALAGPKARRHALRCSASRLRRAIRLRPFWRRRFRTSWPPFVRIRTRKPWVRFRRRLFGWNVLFIGEPH